MSQDPKFNWSAAETLLVTDYTAWTKKYNDGDKRKNFKLEDVEYRNKFGNLQKGLFSFTYQVGQRLHSNQPRCYQGVYMPPAQPTCNFKCQGRECFLKGPAAPNSGKRMLVGSDGRPDVSPPTAGQFEKRFLQKLSGPDQKKAVYVAGYGTPLPIPTRLISTNQYYLPGVKIDQVLKRRLTKMVQKGFANRRMLGEQGVIEGEISGGKAVLST